jgi:putative spermidine/putrescine transport system substrate-binding protein
MTYSDFFDVAVDETKYAKVAPGFFKFLRDMEVNLYSGGGLFRGHYPENQTFVDDLFNANKTDIDYSYSPSYATKNIVPGGLFEDRPSATAYVLDGTIANTNYVAIPINARNKLAALVATNLLSSAAAMWSRENDMGWISVYDSYDPSFTIGGWNSMFDYIPVPSTTPSKKELENAALPELSNAYTIRLEVDWFYCVLNYDQTVSSVTGSNGHIHMLYCG